MLWVIGPTDDVQVNAILETVMSLLYKGEGMAIGLGDPGLGKQFLDARKFLRDAVDELTGAADEYRAEMAKYEQKAGE